MEEDDRSVPGYDESIASPIIAENIYLLYEKLQTIFCRKHGLVITVLEDSVETTRELVSAATTIDATGDQGPQSPSVDDE